MKKNYKKLSKLIKKWSKEKDPKADDNWNSFEKELKENRVEINSLKKYRTTIIVETDYDPSDLGNVALIMDTVTGSAKCIARKTKLK